jgi:hypothetical protein
VSYLRLCGCGHSPQQHGANAAAVDEEEYTRRAKLALRIDEHLEVRLPFWIAVCNIPVQCAEFQPSDDRFAPI